MRTTLIICAHAAVKMKNTYFSAEFYRISGHRGKKRAYVAVAHSMLIAIYHILKDGVFQIPDAKQCEQCVGDALETGYRLIDTAAAYYNEEAVGTAIHASGIPREDLVITTKLWIQDAGYENTLKAFDKSLKKLTLDYLDLYLIHQPFGDYYGSWRAMEKLQKEGLIHAIGVCNFSPDRLIDLCMNSETRPAVNQVEIHPFYQQENALKIMGDFGVMPGVRASLRRAKGHS